MKQKFLFFCKTKSELLITLCFVLLTLLPQSCKKTDTLLNDSNAVNKNEIGKAKNFKSFFDNADLSNPIINRLVLEIKELERKNSFTNDFALRNGYPIWDKIKVKVVKSKKHFKNKVSSFGAGTINDTLVYIPIVLQGGVMVNGYILAQVSDSIEMRLYRAKDYNAYPTTPDYIKTTKEMYALQMMLLDKDVFYRNEYKITDSSIFQTTDNAHKVTFSQANQNSLAEPCEEIEIWWNPDGDACNCSGDEYYTGESYFVGDCDEPETTGGSGTIFIGYFPPPTGTTNIPPTGPTGTGGTSGNPIPPVYPCNPNVPAPLGPGGNLPPCPEPTGGPGWIPWETQEQTDALWSQRHIKDSTNNYCVSQVLNSLNSLNVRLPELFRNIFDTTNGGQFNVTLKMQNFGSDEGAHMEPSNYMNFDYKVFMNSRFEDATNLSVVSSILHEMLHCQLTAWFRQTIVLNDTAKKNYLARQYGYLFSNEIINIDSSLAHIVNGGQVLHHQDIAVRYRNFIGEAIFQYATLKGINVTLTECINVYAWAGCFDSRAFFNSVGSTTQDEIIDAVNAEKDPYGVSVNINGVLAKGTPCL